MQKVDQFLVDINSSGTCNPEQFAFLETVCARVEEEAVTGQDRGGMAETNTEALRWALHGGPGTGKSYLSGFGGYPTYNYTYILHVHVNFSEVRT